MSLDEIFTISDPPSHLAAPVPFKQLTGPRVIVRPYNPSTDLEPLFATTNESTFTYMWFGPFPTLTSFSHGIQTRTALKMHTHVFIDRSTSRTIGSACYHQINTTNRTVEIGAIWVGEEFQGRGLALEAVALMEWQAFRHWGFVRVEWKTHHDNLSSQALAGKVGMLFEGKFRKHMFYKGGFRHSMFYAIIDDDWVDFEPKLLEKLRPRSLVAKVAR
ncbi:hypothetical protein HDV00_012150 [Rhizophlyctis rosea]|nr:hypothetical protein HDV00_012150 [Rhizophlyctis rosea]